MPGTESYDYNQLAEKPKVWGFFVGWFGQDLLNRVYVTASGSRDTELNTGWESCVRAVYRLGVMLKAWATSRQMELPQDPVEQISRLADLCGPEGNPQHCWAGRVQVEVIHL